MSRNMKNERIGEIGYNNFGSKMIIIDMTDSNHITIFFPNIITPFIIRNTLTLKTEK